MSDKRKLVVPLTAIAAAVTFGLGSTAMAQQSQSPAQSQSSQSQQRSSQQSAQRSGASGLDDLATEHRELSTFVEALQAAGLEDSLTSGTQYTVFAPTNEAFEDMRQDKDELLSADNRDELTQMLRSHIVADDVDASRAQQLAEARTLDGGTIEIDNEDGKMKVGDANVVASSIQHGNLRIFAIDQVLDSRNDRSNAGGADSRTRSGAALDDAEDAEDVAEEAADDARDRADDARDRVRSDRDDLDR